jgi:hypothetical protein
MSRLKFFLDLSSVQKVFWILILFSFTLLPILSINAGISGDEPVHYRQAEYVNKYFSSGKTDLRALNTPETNLKYYGQMVDNISYALNSFLGAKNPYVLRHILNALIAALLVLFSSLIAVRISGYKAGILTILFLLISPKILGHSMNNLKDIPFAFGYILSVWGLIRTMENYPKVNIRHFAAIAIGFAIAFGIRAGGLILVPIIILFTCLNWFSFHLKTGYQQGKIYISGLKTLFFLILALSVGYLLGILFWPYALLDPIRNPLESLGMMTNYEVSIRTVFNGHWYWSEKLPWYYAIKWILISSPVIILLGFVLHFIFLKKSEWPIFSLLLFTTLFPLFWTIVKNSNLYGGLRHLIFIYPIICILSSFFWIKVYEKITGKLLNISILALLIVGLIGPLLHTFRNYPVQYVYFNRLAGSVERANGRFDMDYYFHAIKPALKWLEKKLQNDGIEKIPVIASNFEIGEYMNPDHLEFRDLNINYYNRGKFDWDYGVFSSTYIDPNQLREGNWPPKNALFTVFVNEVPVCTVLERSTKNDLLALEAYRKSNFRLADSLYHEVLRQFPEQETSLLYHAWTNRHLENYGLSDSLARALLVISPLSDNALDLIARNAISQEKYQSAIETLQELLKNNYKYVPAYEQISIAYGALGMTKKEALYLEMGYKLGLVNSTSIEKLVNALETIGDQEKAEKFRTILNKL